MSQKYPRTKSDSPMTIRVGRGSSAPISLNIFVNVGMTKTSMNTMTSMATPMMVLG